MCRERDRVPGVPKNIVLALLHGMQTACAERKSRGAAAPPARWKCCKHQLRSQSQSGLFSWLVPSTKKFL